MSPTQEAAMKMALEALLNCPSDISDEMFESIRSLKAALAEPVPVQEPVAWMYEDALPKEYPYDAMWPHSAVRDGVRMFPVFAPPQRPAEPDTDCHAQGICQRSGYSIK
jgi:hypothetical protein